MTKELYESIVKVLNEVYPFTEEVYKKECQLIILDYLQELLYGENKIPLYLEEVQATKEERESLYEWLMEGNVIHDNPSYYADENGDLLDYIRALRFDKIVDEYSCRLEEGEEDDNL